MLFDTGPEAARYLDEIKGVAIEAVGDGENGFARYRITL